MKRNHLLETGTSLLVAAFVLAPLAAHGTELKGYSDREGAMYDNLQLLQQSSHSTVSSERGAQGRIRTETMETSLPAYDGNLYEQFKAHESSKSEKMDSMKDAEY